MPQDGGGGNVGGAPLRYAKGALVGLGSNLASSSGTSRLTLRKSLAALEKNGVVIRAVSGYYTSPAFPAGSGPDFVNAAAWVETALPPAAFLGLLHAVEARLGRVRTVRWGQRTIDLDLLAMEDSVLPDAATHERWRNLPLDRQRTQTPQELILPHPRLQDRAFVLVPLCDIAPDWRHPVLGRTMRQLCEALPDSSKSVVKRLE